MQELIHPYSTPSPLEEVHFNWAKDRNLKFFIKRDDLIHNAVSGNKWRKLKYNILQAQHLNKEGIITFGGAYSNHILATAHACKSYGLKSIAFIRGEELNSSSNSILKQCSDWGMEFVFISREEYRIKDDYDYLNEIKSEYSAYFIVPEGGKNFLGIVGCQEIIKEINQPYDDLWLALGTATTAIGLALSVEGKQMVHAVPALAGFDSKSEIQKILKRQGFGGETEEDIFSRLCFYPEFSFGGYGKTTPELIEFIHKIKEEINLELDPVYTGKAFFAMLKHYKENEDSNKSIIFLHTGGLIAGSELLQK